MSTFLFPTLRKNREGQGTQLSRDHGKTKIGYPATAQNRLVTDLL